MRFLVLSLSLLSTALALTERGILGKFYFKTNGAQWLQKDGWTTGAPICSWYGVTCDKDAAELDEKVIALRLPTNNVAARIPPELYRMPFLKELDLAGNPIDDASFYGFADAANDTMSPLETIDMGSCLLEQLDGIQDAPTTLTNIRVASSRLSAFPEGVCNATSLKELELSFNSMQGTLPTCIGQMKNLKQLLASSNDLTGTIPTELGLLDKMETLALADNDLVGSIPTELNEMLNIQMLSLHANVNLTGPLVSFAKPPNLNKVFLSDCALTGSIPEDFLDYNQNTDTAIMVNLENNQITGTIPEALGRFESLILSVIGNQIQELPSELCNKRRWMNGLVEMYGCDAILCPVGTYNQRGQQTSDKEKCITCAWHPSPFLGATECAADTMGPPSEPLILVEFYKLLDGPRWEHNDGWSVFDSLRDAATLDQLSSVVDYCQFYGILCNTGGQIEFITLSNNGLHGTIPSSLFQLPDLVSIDLSYNSVNLDSRYGHFAVLKEASKLTKLKLSHTDVTSFEGIEEASTLTGLSLDGNKFESTLPTELCGLSNLDMLHLEASSLTGAIPSEIQNLSRLKRLNLNENKITGSLPPEIGKLKNLEYLDLSDNDLSGEVPNSMMHMKQLMSLRVNGAGGGFGGKLPAFQGCRSLEELELAFNNFSGTIPSNLLALAGFADKDRNIRVHLTGNNIEGSVPESLVKFTSLFLELEGNMISGLPQVLCEQSDWMNEEVGLVAGGCDAILCSPGSWSTLGRASAVLGVSCEPCEGNQYYGATMCEASGNIVTREAEILNELYRATGGRYWSRNANWTKIGTPICDREGVICTGSTNEDTHVSELRLEHFGMRGTVPTSIYELPSIRRLALSFNPIDLSFEGISQATSLEVLLLSATNVRSFEGIEQAPDRLLAFHGAKNDVEGQFPTQFYKLSNMRDLFLNENRLTGEIPSEIAQMSSLVTLSLHQNELEGLLPSEIGLLSTLGDLRLHKNRLLGVLPTEMDNLRQLSQIDLSNQRGENKFTGPLFSFASSPLLQKVYLQGNTFAGSIPSDFLSAVNHSEAIDVDLSFNQLLGSIPSEFDSFSQLNIKLQNNMIDGIPQKLCDNSEWMDGVVEVAKSCDAILCRPGTFAPEGKETLQHKCQGCPLQNQAPYFGSIKCNDLDTDAQRDVLVDFYHGMNGKIWANQHNWLSDQSVCTWYGISCDSGSSVTEIRLENNRLENSAADFDVFALLSGLAKLKTLDLKGNAVEVDFNTIPLGFGIEELRLSGTGLKSLNGVANALSVRSLHVQDNDLDGELPDDIFDLTSLSELYLSFNGFNGTISPRISALTNLEELYIYGNRLSGQIPTQIALLKSLKELVLAKNFLSGSIPSEISQMSALEQLMLQDQQGKELIDGQLPSFAEAPNLWYLDASDNALSGPIPDNFMAGVAGVGTIITVKLANNALTGILPSSLKKFSLLNVELAGNKITEIPNVLCKKSQWMDGAVGEVGTCDAILCPRNFYSETGHQESSDSPCSPCSVASPYLGRTTCSEIVSEQEILEELFAKTEGADWAVNGSHWTTSAPICSWEGIECDGDKQANKGVASINLESANLVGQLPPRIWSLPSLRVLNVAMNAKLHVSFEGASRANNLEELFVAGTQLHSLEGISMFPRLKLLNAFRAGLSGTFPGELLELSDTLESLYLSANLLIGMLPTRIGELRKLTHLDVSNSDLHGPLPRGIAHLTKLTELALDETLLSGELPTEISSLPLLRTLSANRKSKTGRTFTGTLPSFDKVPLLETLKLSGNKIIGTIPETFLSSSASVRKVDISSNMLTGSIPVGLDSVSSLKLLVTGNKISEMPTEFCDNNDWMEGEVGKAHFGCDAIMCPPHFASVKGRTTGEENITCRLCSNDEAAAPFFGSTSCRTPADERAILMKLYKACGGRNWGRNDFWNSTADICDWSGVGCDEHGHVILINLEENNLKGTLPSETFDLPQLQVLALSHNAIDLQFDNIGNAKNLLDLRLDNTGLTTLEGISNAISLTAFRASFNSLEGSFPSELLWLKNLRLLTLNENRLTGSLPEWFFKLGLVRRIELGHNRLSGSLPSLSDLKALRYLLLANNDLTGKIPAEFMVGVPLGASISIDLSGNRISGAIPNELARFSELSIALKDNLIDSVSDTLCQMKGWNGGDVGRYGCDAILCPPGKAAEEGRQSSGNSKCVPCHGTMANETFYGQTDCPNHNAGASSDAVTSLGYANIFAVAAAVGLASLLL